MTSASIFRTPAQKKPTSAYCTESRACSSGDGPGKTSGCSGLLMTNFENACAMTFSISSPPWYTAPETFPLAHSLAGSFLSSSSSSTNQSADLPVSGRVSQRVRPGIRGAIWSCMSLVAWSSCEATLRLIVGMRKSNSKPNCPSGRIMSIYVRILARLSATYLRQVGIGLVDGRADSATAQMPQELGRVSPNNIPEYGLCDSRRSDRAMLALRMMRTLRALSSVRKVSRTDWTSEPFLVCDDILARVWRGKSASGTFGSLKR